MPNYDFKCPKCEKVEEVYRTYDQKISAECGQCNIAMDRVWEATPSIFRGGGWGGQ